MRWLKVILSVMIVSMAAIPVEAATKIIKVLPHYLDMEGRHTLNPSLYQRDAYQAQLRKKPELCSTLRFDVQWKGSSQYSDAYKLRMEVITSKVFATKPLVLEQSVKPRGIWSRWSTLKMAPEQFRQMGEVVSWRATLWEGEKQVAEQKSFLWP